MRTTVTVDHFSLYETALGWGGVAASRAGIAEVLLPFGGRNRAALLAEIAALRPEAAEGGAVADLAAARLSAYFRGERVCFDLPLDYTGFSPFRMMVYDYVSSIPCGEVRTYGDVARAIGRPTAARGVGAAMAANPLPIIIPCHRVLGMSGRLTGYSGEGGIESKRWLLRLEGVETA